MMNDPTPAAAQPTTEPLLDQPTPVESNSSDEQPAGPLYHPGHPWYYLPQGDNLPPVPVEQIEPGNTGDTIGPDLPQNGTKREHKLRELLVVEEAELARSVSRYLDIAARGAEALSDYDRNIAYGGNLELARASSLALVHNHICWHKGRIAYIRAELDRFGPLLF